MSNKEYVILLDKNDNQIGVAEKMEAHEKALLHRAVSVFIINSKGDWLLQQRAFEKYHSKGLWSNTCCSHPAPGESSMKAAKRRLMQEMGLETKLEKIFSFTYKAELENNLTEYETDHIFIGITDALPILNPDEVVNFKYIGFQDLLTDLKHNPETYTIWFKMLAERVNMHLLKTEKIK